MQNTTGAHVDAPTRTPFSWSVGTLQLFIVSSGRAFPNGMGCHVGSTIGEYDRAKPVGTEWERRYTKNAVAILNAAYAAGDLRNDKAYVDAAIRKAKDETPYDRPTVST